MSVQRIKEFKLAMPFRPFTIFLKDGRKLTVQDPHHVAVAPDGSRVGITGNDGVLFFWPDSVDRVDTLQVAEKR